MMDGLTEAIQKTLTGFEVRGRVGDWCFLYGDKSGIDVLYVVGPQIPVATYWFNYRFGPDHVEIRNDHRVTQKGYGTPTLRKLETAFLQAGRTHGLGVMMKFVDTDGQEDTQRWLEKNGYTHDTQNKVYIKRLY